MTMFSPRRLLVAAMVAWASFASVQAFSPTPTLLQPRRAIMLSPMRAATPSTSDREEQPSDTKKSPKRLVKKLRDLVKTKRLAKPIALGLLSAAALDRSLSATPIFQFRPRAALASAPVMAPPRRNVVDAETQAMFDVNKRIQRKNEEEMKEYQNKAREIAASQGEAARANYEKEWEAARRERAEEKSKGLATLKLGLLEQGIDPWMDIEGQRQVMLFEKGVDLAEVPGTKFYMEKDFQDSQYKRSAKYQKQAHRFIIKSMVEDMKNKGIDPLEYFEKNKDRSADILNMSTKKAIVVAQQYQENLKQYGQITKPKPGEELAKLDPKEMEAKAKVEAKEAAAAAKREAREARARAKAEAKAKKAELKAMAMKQKQTAREEARLAKESAKKKKAEAKAAAAAMAAGASAAGVLAATSALGDAAGIVEGATAPESGTSGGLSSVLEEVVTDDVGSEPKGVSSKKEALVTGKQESDGSRILPAVAFVVAAGGGSFAFQKLQEKKAFDEEERQRQFRLILGDGDQVGGEANGSKSASDIPLAEFPLDLDEDTMDIEEHNAFEDFSPETTAAEPQSPAPKKQKRGIRSMFGKKNANNREVDLDVLVSESASAPQFALLLSKLLTFGAPGRFPRVTKMKGSMPMEEFDLEAAKEQLTECGTAVDITKEEAAEVFANVVNCMLIDIVDLASSTLKEDDKVTVDAINIVVDFMNHAASLYESIAEGVVITPVTYGGTLGRSKLEQMYSTYAVSGMMSMDEGFNARVGLLQDVFDITEKKAEGLMMKAMQKNMMQMMKDPESMEGMEEMMKSMGGVEGMGGMGGMEGLMGAEGDEGPNPEQLKEMLRMLKEMKDSGTIPPEELEAVRSQFKEAFGSSIEEVMKDADKDQDALGDTDKELLDLMKSILDD